MKVDSGRHWRNRLKHWQRTAQLWPFLVVGGAARHARSQAGRFVVKKMRLGFPSLPPSLDGLTITHLSDLHLGPHFTPMDHLPPVVQACVELNSELICITGDFVDIRNRALAEGLPKLRELRAPLGIYACLGNHDLYESRREVVGRLRSWLGPGLLVNEAATIRRGGSTLGLVGLDFGIREKATRDIYRLRPRWPVKADFIVALAHNPHAFDDLAALGADLTLSGHTHGGQISLTKAPLPVVGPAAGRFRYPRGHYSVGEIRLYVSCGLGHSVPFRLNAPSEVAQITLSREPGVAESVSPFSDSADF